MGPIKYLTIKLNQNGIREKKGPVRRAPMGERAPLNPLAYIKRANKISND